MKKLFIFSVFFLIINLTVVSASLKLSNPELPKLGRDFEKCSADSYIYSIDFKSKDIECRADQSSDLNQSVANDTYLKLDQSTPQIITGGQPTFGDGFNLSGDIGTSHLTNPLFFDEDGTIFYITNQGLGGGKSAFITIKRNDNTGSSGFALGEVGATDIWDIMVPSGNNNLWWYNIGGGSTKSAYMESATGHYCLGCTNPKARLHSIDNQEQLRLAPSTTGNWSSIHTDSLGHLYINSTGNQTFFNRKINVTDGGIYIRLNGTGTRQSNDNVKIEGRSRKDYAGTPLLEVEAENSDGNAVLFEINRVGSRRYSVDNEGDTFTQGGFSMGGGTIVASATSPCSTCFNFISAKDNGFLLHGYLQRPKNTVWRMGYGVYAEKTLASDYDWDELTIERDVDAMGYTESGTLISLRRDVTNGTAEGIFMNWSDDTLGLLGEIEGDGDFNITGNMSINGNANITKNLYVGGCINYNCSGVGGCITLGSCV